MAAAAVAFVPAWRHFGPLGMSPELEEVSRVPAFASTIADRRCACCNGSGERGHGRHATACRCVWRAVFRACFKRWHHARSRADWTRTTLFRSQNGRSSKVAFGRPYEEFIADFELIAKRTLTAQEWSIFDLHFLKGVEYRGCCQAVRTDRGNFFHAVYRIQEKLGRVFATVRPYALYPLQNYFNS